MTFWYWLLSWLPFEWAAPDTMLFMKNALLAVLVVTPLFGLLSTMVVESRMAFFSDALGHSAFTGMAIGALCGLTRPVGAAVVFAVVIALLFTLVRQKTHMASDTAISVFSSAAVALGNAAASSSVPWAGRASRSSIRSSSATSSASPPRRSAFWPSSSWPW